MSTGSNQLGLEGREQVGRGELHNPEIRVALQLSRNIGIGCVLVDTVGSGGAHPGGGAVGGADLGEDADAVAVAQDDEDSAGVGVAFAQDGAGPSVGVAEAERGLDPEAGFEPGFFAHGGSGGLNGCLKQGGGAARRIQDEREGWMAEAKAMTDAQLAYEAKRAAKAGKSLDAWMAQKRKRQETVAAPGAAPGAAAKAAKKPGLISRLIDRAHKPLKK